MRTHRPSLSSPEEKSRNKVGVLENVPGINIPVVETTITFHVIGLG